MQRERGLTVPVAGCDQGALAESSSSLTLTQLSGLRTSSLSYQSPVGKQVGTINKAYFLGSRSSSHQGGTPEMCPLFSTPEAHLLLLCQHYFAQQWPADLHKVFHFMLFQSSLLSVQYTLFKNLHFHTCKEI